MTEQISRRILKVKIYFLYKETQSLLKDCPKGIVVTPDESNIRLNYFLKKDIFIYFYQVLLIHHTKVNNFLIIIGGVFKLELFLPEECTYYFKIRSNGPTKSSFSYQNISSKY
jgi:hypothetical protein